MRKTLVLVLAVGLCLCASSALAQIANPTKVNFTASLDHALITSYEIAYFVGTATTTPLALTDLGKPAPDTVTGCAAPSPCIEATIVITTLPNGEYVARVRAKQIASTGTQYSEWSDPSNSFLRSSVRPPSGVLIKK